MIERSVLIRNRTGIHARPASQFVRLAGKFQSSITIDNGEESANAKSIIKVLSLGIAKGTTVNLTFDGTDETEAADEVTNFLNTLAE